MTRPVNSASDTKLLVQIDPDLQAIVPGFLENRRKDVVSIRAAIAGSDFESMRILGHRMKGDGGGYGFETISEIGAALEHAAARHDLPALTRQVQALEDYLNRVTVVYR